MVIILVSSADSAAMRALLIIPVLIGWAHCAHDVAHVELDAVPPNFTVKKGPSDGVAVAWGTFENSITETGFSYLEIATNASYPDHYQAYAAGILEGYFTRKLISMHFNNTMRDYCKGQEDYCERLHDFLNSNLRYVQENIKNRKTDPFWYQTDLALTQLMGIQDSWKKQKHESYFPNGKYDTVTDVLFLNVDGDLEDLEQALKSPKLRRVTGGGHCSALVKVLPDNSDLCFSHVTWSGYSTMLRILKKYTLNYQTTYMSNTRITAPTMTFSSSPGRIFSGDDFHLMSSGVASMETTIGNSDPSKWRFIKPECNLEWLRTIVANRLASTGQEWADLFKREGSGTYNNQWMIVDYKKFTPGKPIRPGTLTVLEEIPGLIVSGDQSKLLSEQAYWPSYNVPFYPEIYGGSGWKEQVEKFGDWFTYDKNPRSQIFRRDQGMVRDIGQMFKLMRYNDFKNDELSRCNCTPPYSAENAISARCDLNPANGTYPFGALGHRSHGATDAKVTCSKLFETLEFLAVAGPTYDPLPPFKWSESGLNDLHEGHPDLWFFNPEIHRWHKAGTE
ncbi:putative phospholipase B-like 2 [Galendromus occidentalis]|uniref:Phospholipase B-like n=1 Tax=Galendromus occidentalis TaxID=34638 RepID=A0AAJ6QW80_9ACAR|nr:putative phospholipase B-like 2 [Galendromus occidentalis]